MGMIKEKRDTQKWGKVNILLYNKNNMREKKKFICFGKIDKRK